MDKSPIERAVDATGGISKLARAVGVKPPTVQQWVNKKRPVPIGRMPAIEKACKGTVTRKDFRPDDWQAIWPELADKRRKAA